MNSKLVIFVLVIIGFQSINSSVVKTKTINSFARINSNSNDEDPYKIIQNLTFNISNTAVLNGMKFPELKCNDELAVVNKINNFCTIGNGKYQATIVKCINSNYGIPNRLSDFKCELLNSKILNKNVVKGAQSIICFSPFDQETAKGRCKYEYNFKNSNLFNEKDDIENN